MIRKILHKPQALLGLAMMLIVFFVVAFAPFIAPHDPSELNVAHALSAPDSEYPLGTDEMGRCVFSRLLYGARSSMSIALPSLIILALVSTVVATVCAYLGGVLDRIFDVVSNIFMAFPPFLVAITLVGLFESKVFEYHSIHCNCHVGMECTSGSYLRSQRKTKTLCYHLPDVRLFRTEDYIPAYYSKCPSTSFGDIQYRTVLHYHYDFQLRLSGAGLGGGNSRVGRHVRECQTTDFQSAAASGLSGALYPVYSRWI